MTGDPIEQARDDVQALIRDYFSVGDSEADTLWKVMRSCARTGGVVMAGTGAVAGAAAGGVTVPGIGAVPGWVAGGLAGFLGGTTACVIARRSIAEQVKPLLSRSGRSEQEFKQAVRAVLRNPLTPMNDPASRS